MEIGAKTEIGARDQLFLILGGWSYKMDNELLHEIRETTNQELVLGREDFKDRIELMLQRKARKGTPGRPCVREESGDYYVYVY